MLHELKRYLRITWEDEDTEAYVDGILQRAKAKLNRYAGTEIDFDANADERQLLLDCCRYIYNHAAEHFEEDFSGELIALRNRYAVEGYLDEQSTEVSGV